MRWLPTIILGLLACAACETKAPPEGVLSQAEMVQALKTLYIAEEHVSRFGLKPDSARKYFARLESRLFDRMGIEPDTFERSFDYYVQNPDEWEQVYSALVDTLNLEEQRFSLPDVE